MQIEAADCKTLILKLSRRERFLCCCCPPGSQAACLELHQLLSKLNPDLGFAPPGSPGQLQPLGRELSGATPHRWPNWLGSSAGGGPGGIDQQGCSLVPPALSSQRGGKPERPAAGKEVLEAVLLRPEYRERSLRVVWLARSSETYVCTAGSSLCGIMKPGVFNICLREKKKAWAPQSLKKKVLEGLWL